MNTVAPSALRVSSSRLAGLPCSALRHTTALRSCQVSRHSNSLTQRPLYHCNSGNFVCTSPRFFGTAPSPQFSQSSSAQQNSARMTDDTKVTKLAESDFDEWAALFRQYIDFYKSSIPEEQYRNTFKRILDDKSDLYALVLRQGSDGSGKMVGLAHFYPHQTPWSEKQICHFNDLFIDPTIRSKGYGRKMMMAVAEAAKEMGCFRLEWATQHGNTTARILYDKLGTCDFVEYRMPLDK